MIRNDYTLEEVRAIYQRPFLDLILDAARIHREHHPKNEIQVCTLLSVKTGGCSEDCSYCSQSARNPTEVSAEGFLDVESVRREALNAKAAGSSRFCMGVAWRDMKQADAPASKKERIAELTRMVSAVSETGLEVCLTAGMLDKEDAFRLKEAGLTAYNHNLDTSREYYHKIVTTRTYDDRLETLRNLFEVGISVCCGGIIGMGEAEDDRIRLLHTLATLPAHPESVPVNNLVPVKGTPLENVSPASPIELVRVIATARILMPLSRIRLSAGREALSDEAQALCFLAGANSIFSGEKLLTAPNAGRERDAELLAKLGLNPSPLSVD